MARPVGYPAGVFENNVQDCLDSVEGKIDDLAAAGGEGDEVGEARLRVDELRAALAACRATLDEARASLIRGLVDYGGVAQGVAEGRAREIEGNPQGTLANQASTPGERGLAEAKIAFDETSTELAEAIRQMEILQAGQNATLATVAQMIQNFEGRMVGLFERLDAKVDEKLAAQDAMLSEKLAAQDARLDRKLDELGGVLGRLKVEVSQRVQVVGQQVGEVPARVAMAQDEAAARERAARHTGQWVRHMH